MQIKQVKLEIYTPESCLQELISQLSKMGACRIGQYSYVSSYAKVSGTWLPEEGSQPYEGEIGKVCTGEEYKLEVRCEYDKIEAALQIIEQYHPDEEPAINVIPLINDVFHVQ